MLKSHVDWDKIETFSTDLIRDFRRATLKRLKGHRLPMAGLGKNFNKHLMEEHPNDAQT
jgi:hypothetical protein